jgi:hypothetical protein
MIEIFFYERQQQGRRGLHYEDLQVLFLLYIDLLLNDHDREVNSAKNNRDLADILFVFAIVLKSG